MEQNDKHVDEHCSLRVGVHRKGGGATLFTFSNVQLVHGHPSEVIITCARGCDGNLVLRASPISLERMAKYLNRSPSTTLVTGPWHYMELLRPWTAQHARICLRARLVIRERAMGKSLQTIAREIFYISGPLGGTKAFFRLFATKK